MSTNACNELACIQPTPLTHSFISINLFSLVSMFHFSDVSVYIVFRILGKPITRVFPLFEIVESR